MTSATLNPKNWGLGTYFNPNTWTTPKLIPSMTDSIANGNGVKEAPTNGNALASDNAEPPQKYAESAETTPEDSNELSSSQHADPMASSQATLTETPIRETLNQEPNIVEDLTTSQPLPTESQALLADASTSSLITVSETSSLASGDIKPRNEFRHLNMFLPSRMQGASEVILRRKVWYTTVSPSIHCYVVQITQNYCLVD
jgi:hypothetical protein